MIRGYSYSWNGPVWEDLCIMLGNPPDFPKEQDMLTFIKLVGNIMWTKSKQLETLSKCHGGHQQTVFGQYCILWRNKKSIEIHIWSRPFPNILWSHIFSTAPNKPTAAALQPITLKGVRPGSHGSPSRSSFTIGLRRNVHGMNALLPSLSSTPETKQDCYVNPLWNLDWWTLLTPMYVAIWGEMGWCWKEDQHGYPVAGKTVATFFGQDGTWGLFDLLTPQSTPIHFACSMFFSGNVGIDSILKNEPLDFQSPGSLEPNLWNSSSALPLPQGQIIPATQQHQLYQLAIAGLSHHFKSRLKSFAFPHFDGMRFNHQRGTCHDPTIKVRL